MPQIIDAVTVEGLLTHTSKVCVPATQATAASTLSLTVASNMSQYFTGTTAGQIVRLPNATTLAIGQRYEIYNQSTQSIDIQDGASGALLTLPNTTITYLTLQLNGNSAGSWIFWSISASVVAGGVTNFNLTSSTAFTTSSQTDVVITGFTVTPSAGTYGIWYNASVYYTTTPKAHYWSIYKAGVGVADSARQQDTAHSNQTMVDSTMSIVQVNGSQAIDVRVRCANTGALTVNDRSLLLSRLGS